MKKVNPYLDSKYNPADDLYYREAIEMRQVATKVIGNGKLDRKGLSIAEEKCELYFFEQSQHQINQPFDNYHQPINQGRISSYFLYSYIVDIQK